MRGTVVVGSFYKRGKTYYFKYTDKSGARRQVSTGRQTIREAREFAEKFIDRMQFGTCPTTLKDELEKYTDPKTNPRRKALMVIGGSYGKEYSFSVAGVAKGLLVIIPKPVLSQNLQCFSRVDVRTICEGIIRSKGYSRSAQRYFQTLKIVFNQAEDDGLIERSPAKGLPNIKYDKKRLCSLPAECVRTMLEDQSLFRTQEAYQFFAVAALTGMRRGEIYALTSGQIHDGMLTIDRAVKSADMDDIGLPKSNVERIIPLPHLAQEVLSGMKPKDGRYFPVGRSWATDEFRKIKTRALRKYPEWKTELDSLSPHLLRHTLNTNLIVSGANPIYIDEYLGWHHQELIDMQMNYLHLVAFNLKEVSDTIDRIYAPKESQIHLGLA